MNSNSYPAVIGAAFAVLAAFAPLMGAGLAALAVFAARKYCKNLWVAMQVSRKHRSVRDLVAIVDYAAVQPTNNSRRATSRTMIAVKTACDEPLTGARQAGGRQLTNALRRYWSAYKAWRLEQAAINELSSLTDRELKDIGLYRCGIVGAVRDRARPERTFFSRTENQSGVAGWGGDTVVGVVAVPTLARRLTNVSSILQQNRLSR